MTSAASGVVLFAPAFPAHIPRPQSGDTSTMNTGKPPQGGGRFALADGGAPCSRFGSAPAHTANALQTAPSVSLHHGTQNNRSSAARSNSGRNRVTTRNETSLRQGVRPVFFVVRDAAFFAESCGRDRRVGAGPGVAWPKSRCTGCEPAALATESFPGALPGRYPAAARAASAFRCL